MPVYAKLSTEPLQTVDAYILKQALWRINACTQSPADSILELLQPNATRTALLVNEANQIDGGNWRLGGLDTKELAGVNAKRPAKPANLIRRVTTPKLTVVTLNIPNAFGRNTHLVRRVMVSESRTLTKLAEAECR